MKLEGAPKPEIFPTDFFANIRSGMEAERERVGGNSVTLLASILTPLESIEVPSVKAYLESQGTYATLREKIDEINAQYKELSGEYGFEGTDIPNEKIERVLSEIEKLQSFT